MIDNTPREHARQQMHISINDSHKFADWGRGVMTDISLPYNQVCEIIAEEAIACAGPKKLSWTEDFKKQERLLVRFGHTLLRALEEAHLARQGRPDEAEMAGHDGRYDGQM